MYVTYKGLKFDVDSKGNLADVSQFSKEWVEYNAVKIKLELTETHWKILEEVRNYWLDFQEAPSLRAICKMTDLKSSEILKAFPGGMRTILKFAAA